MFTLQDADRFFAEHLLHEKISEFSDEKKLAAVQTAARDIAAALEVETLPEILPENIRSAVFEQAAFLLFNPRIFTGNPDNEPFNTIAPRARMMLPEKNHLRCTLQRG